MIRSAGGELELDVEPGGASFTFWLPAAAAGIVPPAPAVAREDGRGNGSLRDRVILVADDEAAIRNVLERFLRREGSRVRLASGGREALDVIRSEPVDAVLLDFRMPGVDGAQVYRTMVQEQGDVARRTVFLSGDIAGVAQELGVPEDRVLLKPVELTDLKRVLLTLLRSELQSNPHPRPEP
jgi:CheY-like chemotaxis protein